MRDRKREGGREDWNTHFKKKAGRKLTLTGNSQGTEDNPRIFKPEENSSGNIELSINI